MRGTTYGRQSHEGRGGVKNLVLFGGSEVPQERSKKKEEKKKSKGEPAYDMAGYGELECSLRGGEGGEGSRIVLQERIEGAAVQGRSLTSRRKNRDIKEKNAVVRVKPIHFKGGRR